MPGPSLRDFTSYSLPPLSLAFVPLSALEIHNVQELLDHEDVKTTMIYTHVLNRGGMGVKSPADAIFSGICRSDNKKTI